MLRALSLLLPLTALLYKSHLVASQPRNEGGEMDACYAWGRNDLTPVVGRNLRFQSIVLAGTNRILYAPARFDDPDFRAAIQTETGGVVDYFDARYDTPSVGLLNTYDCVFTHTDYAYVNNIEFGDNLASFVDSGGTVVLGPFTTFTTRNHLSGKIMTSNYSPVTGGANHYKWSDYKGNDNGFTSIHSGVDTYKAFYRDALTLQGQGQMDGTYMDGEIAEAYRPDFHVIYSNGAHPDAGENWPRLIANACAGEGLVALCKDDFAVQSPRDCAAKFARNGGFTHTDSTETVNCVQDPPGPYPIGVTEITRTCTETSGRSASCTNKVTVLDVDSDGDGVKDCDDLCPGTSIPEARVPSKDLRKDHWALIGGDTNFDVSVLCWLSRSLSTILLPSL